MTDMLHYENIFYKEGYQTIAGVDEAGRGPLAGPVCAAAVIFPKDVWIPEINDSKKLSESKREALFPIIIEQALAYGIAFVDEKRIDEINILNATFEAMKAAVDALQIRPDFVFIDGNRIKGIDIPHQCIVKGDTLSMSIAAASILAKVSRDRLMKQLDEKYPEYHFKKHKGYGTKEHIERILQYGPSEIHRKTFLSKIGPFG